MTETTQPRHSDDSESGMRKFCLCLIGFISDFATDPHLYFSQRFSSDAAKASTVGELRELLAQLTDWVDTLGIYPDHQGELNRVLAADGLPSYSLMRDPDGLKLGMILIAGYARNQQEYRLVRDSMADGKKFTAGDRTIAERVVMAYEPQRD
jgi:hypothetical protein